MNTPLLGFYGKVPSLGDFVGGGLPKEFISVWDDWQQRIINASEEQLGENWMNAAFTSPIWRFFLSPGIGGENAWAGVMMPSMDKVGRYFPLTIAHVIAPEWQQALFLFADTWFEQLENLVLSALEADFDRQQFEQRLTQTIPEHYLLDLQALVTEQPQEFSQFTEQLAKIGTVKMLSHSVKTNTGINAGFSYWAAQNAQYQKTFLLCPNGLPDQHHCLGFLADSGEQANEMTTIEDDNTLPYISPKLTNQEEHGDVLWVAHDRTDPGKKRKKNEDAQLNKPEAGLWVVADGMGGHQSGDIASNLVVAGLADIDVGSTLDEKIANVTTRLMKINTELCAYAEGIAKGNIIGTTVVALLVKGLHCAAIWAGDSRLYRYREGQLQQLTHDHTLINELIASGMSKDQAERQAGANIITSAIGGQVNISLDVIRFEAEYGDRYLLCSDGLDKELSDEEIAGLMGMTDCRQVADALINKVLSQTARDNVTVIVCQVLRADK